MKSIIGIGFALSVLGATSAIAAPHATQAVVATTTVSQPATVNVNTVGIEHQDAGKAKLYVAENRPEFGSKYQRY
ncbi:hypothetical protein DKY63_07625 [Pseudomonas putida]|uniref:DUF2790 domain-containing protein n=1 Tax=Pseudomonas putida TaxID=303 RepID=A0A2Z4RFR5_PSEPU|nr:hypothetical protein [Pseudomonas putida]AWY39777.1 hypothetical protein DKY63_07625 [Pseudomonas putida]